MRFWTNMFYRYKNDRLVYLNIRTEVGDFLPAGVVQMVVCPSQEQLLWGKFHQILQSLTFSEQCCQRWESTHMHMSQHNDVNTQTYTAPSACWLCLCINRTWVKTNSFLQHSRKSMLYFICNFNTLHALISVLLFITCTNLPAHIHCLHSHLIYLHALSSFECM